MKRSKITECMNDYCSEPVYLGGRCKKHSEEHQHKYQEDNDAISLLHQGKIDNKGISNSDLKIEYCKLADFWYDVCSSVNLQRNYGSVPLSTSEFAVSWCEIIAKEILRDEREYREKGHISRSREYGCSRSWDQINELLDANTQNNT